MADEVNVLFHAGATGLVASTVLGGYDPGNLVEVDRAIRHMPAVVAHITAKANEMLNSIEKRDDFQVIVSNNAENARARAYVAPRNNAGIHLEMADSVLLKAALGMQGK